MAIKPTKLFRLRILAAISLLAVCGLVRAEVAAWEPHWYLSLNAGENEVDKSRWEDSETTAVFVGYQFEPHIAVELGYVDLGEFDYTELADTSVEIDGYELVLVATGQLADSLELFGRIGTYAWEGSRSVLGTEDLEKDDHTAVVGVGLEYSFSESIGALITASRYDDVSNGDITSLTVGIEIEF